MTGVDLTPEDLPITVPKGEVWYLPIDMGLGDLTNATITVRQRLDGAEVSEDMDVVHTPEDLLASTFYFGQSAGGAEANYAIRITLPGATQRTFITGRIRTVGSSVD